jgi:hypothetical protein
MTGLHILT